MLFFVWYWFNVVTVITRCISKPSRQESVQIATPHTRKRQRDRYVNYGHRLQENELYSLLISSNGIECHGKNCQPSIFNASHRCRTITSDQNIDPMDGVPLMNEQEIKQNISYVSLTNLIDEEPHVSRRDSYSQSTSHTLMHKPSMFLADLLSIELAWFFSRKCHSRKYSRQNDTWTTSEIHCTTHTISWKSNQIE